MSFLDWLLGKPKPTGTTTTSTISAPAAPVAPPAAAPPATSARATAANGAPAAPRSPEENLKRWRESGEPRKWVEARKGLWNHDDWVALLDALQKSEFWPMDAEAIGRTLEELKQGLAVANGRAAH